MPLASNLKFSLRMVRSLPFGATTAQSSRPLGERHSGLAAGTLLSPL